MKELMMGCLMALKMVQMMVLVKNLGKEDLMMMDLMNMGKEDLQRKDLMN